MREIKFRGYAKQNMVNSQWLEGFGIYEVEFAEHYAKEVGRSSDWFIFTESGNYLVDPKSIGQYTGLKDINGNEIYEGDIVKCYRENNSLVCMKFQAFGLRTNGLGFVPFYEVYGHCEVIGNIYENPDLLEGDSN